MAYTLGTFLIWVVALSIGIPIALMALYQLFKARMFIIASVVLIGLAAALYFDPAGFLILCAFVAAPFVVSRIRNKAWSLDGQIKAKVQADRASKGYGNNL